MGKSADLPSMIHNDTFILYKVYVKYSKIVLTFHLHLAVTCFKYLQLFTSCKNSFQTISLLIEALKLPIRLFDVEY